MQDGKTPEEAPGMPWTPVYGEMFGDSLLFDESGQRDDSNAGNLPDEHLDRVRPFLAEARSRKVGIAALLPTSIDSLDAYSGEIAAIFKAVLER
jgi:hypothetical protein